MSSMQIVNKCKNVKVADIIASNYSLYIDRPQFGCRPVTDSLDTFHLISDNEENKLKWYKLFVESVVEFCCKHRIFIVGNLEDDKIIFKDLENVRPSRKDSKRKESTEAGS